MLRMSLACNGNTFLDTAAKGVNQAPFVLDTRYCSAEEDDACWVLKIGHLEILHRHLDLGQITTSVVLPSFDPRAVSVHSGQKEMDYSSGRQVEVEQTICKDLGRCRDCH